MADRKEIDPDNEGSETRIRFTEHWIFGIDRRPDNLRGSMHDSTPIAMLAITIPVAGCSGPMGDKGEKGDQGAPGSPGKQGDAGKNGAPGKDGKRRAAGKGRNGWNQDRPLQPYADR
jgi:hypothetical protein